MKIVVADSSALILLTKVQLIQPVVKHMEVYIPQAVYEEAASSSLQGQFPDAKEIESLIQEGKITVKEVKKHQKLPVVLGKGEEDAIILFTELKADLLLCDDGKALKVCRHLKIPFIISPRLAVEFYKKGWLDLKRTIDALEQLREIGRYAPDIIGRAFLELGGNK